MAKKRKSQEVSSKLREIEKSKEELEKKLEEASQEDQQVLSDAEEKIQKVLKEKDLFCGAILDSSDILQIVELALRTGEKVKIPFRLYFNE